MEIVVIWIICMVIGGAIGSSKGRTGAGVALGGLLGIIGIVIAACMSPSPEKKAEQLQQVNDIRQERHQMEGMRDCPHCAERIKSHAKVCRYCNRDVT